MQHRQCTVCPQFTNTVFITQTVQKMYSVSTIHQHCFDNPNCTDNIQGVAVILNRDSGVTFNNLGSST